MTDRLTKMLQQQLDLQIDSFKVDPAILEGDARAEFIRWNVLALTDELHEMLAEVGWKPWATSRHVNVDEAFSEMVDAWHFFMNILFVLEGAKASDLGLDLNDPDLTESLATRLTAGYQRKHEVNATRQREGYDGVSSKCPKCHRDLAEVEVRKFEDNEVIAYYCPCGGVLTVMI